MTELEKLNGALEVAVGALKSISQGSCPTWLRNECYGALESIDSILNPPTEMETVESVMWQILEPNGSKRGCYPDFEPTLSAEEEAKGWQVVKHTGTYHRPKKQPVEKSVSLGNVVIGPDGGMVDWPTDPHFDTTSLFQRTEAAGKTVTLTATWTE